MKSKHTCPKSGIQNITQCFTDPLLKQIVKERKISIIKDKNNSSEKTRPREKENVKTTFNILKENKKLLHTWNKISMLKKTKEHEERLFSEIKNRTE